MIAITIRLPWAAAIRAGVKTTENRGRPIADRHIGSLVAIHAATTWSTEGAADLRILEWWRGHTYHRWPLDPTDFRPLFRKVIAVATITGCHEAMQPVERVDFDGGGDLLVEQPGTCCAPFGDRDYNGKPAWHIVFADIVALPTPVGPVRGSLSVPWTLPDAVAAQVTEQLAEVTT